MAVLSIEEQLALKQQQLLDIQKGILPAAQSVAQSQSEPSTVTSTSTSTPITMEQIQEMIDAGVAKKLSEMGGLPVTPKKETKKTPLELMNEMFTSEEVVWLCNPKIYNGIQSFLLENYIYTEEGKDILKQIFQAYRKSHG